MSNFMSKLGALTVVFFTASSAAQAQQPTVFTDYLYEAVKTDKVLAAEFAAITKPLSMHFPWVAKYGTATPAEIIQVAGQDYAVYQGCKPHNCPAESYVLIYSPSAKKMLAGAFIQNKYSQSTFLDESKISWLGTRATEFAPVLSKYLF